jgi:hypothetical protein
MEMVKHFFLWISVIILFVAAAVVLELFEGYKIMTTEYYGLRNIKLIFVFMMFFYALVFYPITLLPISLTIRKVVKSPIIPFFIYSLLGGIGGFFMFQFLYNDSFVVEYDLKMSSSILIFAVVGFIYALTENVLHRRMSE